MRLSLRLGLLTLALASAAVAQTAPDWETRPALAPAPTFAPPTIETYTLSSGLPVYFVQKPGVPLAQIDLHVRTGSVSDGDLDGLAAFAADMMDEGAGSLDALELADAVDFLGIDLGVGAGLHSLAVRLHTPLSKLDDALALMADVALRPTFPEADLERVRTSRLTDLRQRADQPRSIAGVALAAAVYGDHPYGRLGTGEPGTLSAISRNDLVAFHENAVQPRKSALVVVAAAPWADLSARLDDAFGEDAGWSLMTRSAVDPALTLADPAPTGERRVTLVDKPGAAQSVVRIGRVAAARSTPDYYALDVLNTILGGSFTSRLNQNLRERNGYSYGAGSAFQFRPVAGPFVAYSDVQTDVTAPALQELFNELEAIGERVPEVALDKARDYLALSFPQPFATVRGTARMVEELVLNGLPLDTYAAYASGVRAVIADDLERVAARYLDPSRVEVIVVGDRAVVEEGVRALDLGPLDVRTVEDVLGSD